MDKKEFIRWVGVLAKAGYLIDHGDSVELTDKFREELSRAICLVHERTVYAQDDVAKEDMVVGVLAVNMLSDAGIDRVNVEEMAQVMTVTKALIAAFYDSDVVNAVMRMLDGRGVTDGHNSGG